LTIPAASSEANRSLYFYEGDALQIADESAKPNYCYELVPDENIVITNGEQKSHLLFLQGMPIKERVVHYGPFVMNTEGEIQQAMMDYQKTRFGGWPWPRHDMVHQRKLGRFAKYPDGKEEVRG
jgi:redox-sensitive bicupin YhaK (pirin superfamily)